MGSRERLGAMAENVIAEAIARFTSMALESVDLDDTAQALRWALDAAQRDLERTRSLQGRQ